MYNIKQDSGNIVATSITPKNMLAKVVKENLALKAQLDTKPEVVQAPTPKSHDRIQGQVDKQKERDAIALESQKAYVSNDTFTLRKTGAKVYATGTPNQHLFDKIGQDNTLRMDKGLKPFLTYAQWELSPLPENKSPIKGFTFVNAYDIEDPTMSKSTPVYIVSQKYYIMKDGATTYIYNNDPSTKSAKVVNRLVKDNGNGPAVDNTGTVKGGNKVTNLSDAEYNDIIKAKPSYNDLMQVYVCAQNYDELQMNFNQATKVW